MLFSNVLPTYRPSLPARDKGPFRSRLPFLKPLSRSPSPRSPGALSTSGGVAVASVLGGGGGGGIGGGVDSTSGGYSAQDETRQQQQQHQQLLLQHQLRQQRYNLLGTLKPRLTGNQDEADEADDEEEEEEEERGARCISDSAWHTRRTNLRGRLYSPSADSQHYGRNSPRRSAVSSAPGSHQACYERDFERVLLHVLLYSQFLFIYPDDPFSLPLLIYAKRRSA